MKVFGNLDKEVKSMSIQLQRADKVLPEFIWGGNIRNTVGSEDDSIDITELICSSFCTVLLFLSSVVSTSS